LAENSSSLARSKSRATKETYICPIFRTAPSWSTTAHTDKKEDIMTDAMA